MAATGEVVPQVEVVPHAQAAWEFFNRMGAPKFHVAPMVDQSELPFRLLCRKYGATCAYTPMFHARIFCEDVKYRQEVWTTCPEDRPVLVQFCANDPNYLVQAAQIVAPKADAIDINFGCPQRIAKRGNYGSFLMDDLPLVERLVKGLVAGVDIPVTCKIRVFPELKDTLAYARMVERSGCSVLAVHGRTREQKDNSGIRADWDQIKAVKAALQIPVLANGNIQYLADAYRCMEYTGCDGVLSAESILEDPALFDPRRLTPEGAHTPLESIQLCVEYLQYCQKYTVPHRMVKGHIYKLLSSWLSEFTDLRDQLNQGRLDLQARINLVLELQRRAKETGRSHPVPTLTPRMLQKMAKEAAVKAAIEEQDREEQALKAIGVILPSAAPRHSAPAPDTTPAPLLPTSTPETSLTTAVPVTDLQQPGQEEEKSRAPEESSQAAAIEGGTEVLQPDEQGVSQQKGGEACQGQGRFIEGVALRDQLAPLETLPTTANGVIGATDAKGGSESPVVGSKRTQAQAHLKEDGGSPGEVPPSAA